MEYGTKVKSLHMSCMPFRTTRYWPAMVERYGSFALPYACPNKQSVCHRIQAKTRELREKQAKEREYAEIQDIVGHTFSSDEEHTYAGIGSLNSSVDSSSMDPYSHHYHLPQSPQSSHPPQSHQNNGPPLEALYAQVNKPRNGRPAAPDR